MSSTGVHTVSDDPHGHERGPLRAVDSLGRVVIPVEIRREFGLIAGDFLAISVVDDGIMLRPMGDHCGECGRPNVRVAQREVGGSQVPGPNASWRHG